MRKRWATGSTVAGLVLVAACGTSPSATTSPSVRATVAAAAASLTPAGAADVYPLMAGYQGHYSGSWNDSTFNTTGSMTWDVSADNATRQVTIKVAVGGKFFGGPGAPAETIVLSHLAEGTISGHSASFGEVAGTITPAGVMQVTLTKIGLGVIDHVDITGQFTAAKTITMRYTVYFATGGQTAVGTVTLTKS
jgi:hypothetical protein